MRRYVYAHDDGKILSGVSIDGVDVSGMTKEEALVVLVEHRAYLQQKQIDFRLESGSASLVRLVDLDFNILDMEQVIEKALNHGRSGAVLEQVRVVRAANRGRLEQDFSVVYKTSQVYLVSILESRMIQHLSLPENATVTNGQSGVVVIPEQLGQAFEIEGTHSNLQTYLNEDWLGENSYVMVSVYDAEPEITSAHLADVTDLLGTFTSVYSESVVNRVQNIENAAGFLNHMLLQPGDEISVVDRLVPFTLENGFAKGASFEGNLVVETIGGGVCQVSTTIYNALLYAEIEIVERHAHSMLVAYAPPAQDAAVAEGLLDLRFRNHLDFPIYIEAVVEPGYSITYNIFGKETRPANRHIEFVSEFYTGEIPNTVHFVATEAGIGSIGAMHSPQASVTAQLIKIIFIDGVEVERETVNFSNYMEAPLIMGVGVFSHNPDDEARMRSAIATQNEDVIQETIRLILQGPSIETGWESPPVIEYVPAEPLPEEPPPIVDEPVVDVPQETPYDETHTYGG